MFDLVAKVNIHVQQINSLLKQRRLLQSRLCFDAISLKNLEIRLLNHVYALSPLICVSVTDLTDLEQAEIVSKLDNLVEDIPLGIVCFCILLKAHPNERLSFIKQIHTAPEFADYWPLFASLIKLSEQEHVDLTEQVKAYHYQEDNALAIYQIMLQNWQAGHLDGHLNSAHHGQFEVDGYLSSLLLAHTELSLAPFYLSDSDHLATYALLRGLLQNNQDARAALIKRFAQATSIDHKAQLLSLAGLTDSDTWLEPCSIFCQNHPDYIIMVLPHFQHKQILPLIIKLMSLAQCYQQAYAIWLMLTDYPLVFESAISLVDSDSKSDTHKMPNINQAELHRQQIMKKPGDKILMGQDYTADNAHLVLHGKAGKAAQLALLSKVSFSHACALFDLNFSHLQWESLFSSWFKVKKRGTD
ncbi:hypothetical protein HR060_15450 [Catenovulum sp. SM1970]|uniref:hypothetical protein n=1 Tax=Marinifaba aquimaris TaxID=2741323 RepID=UPI0015747915|nr:hypothetical protein [Marinifaba aquimaris]NTS78246.1 hypothetical protein [Marinifaba aquimaris]